MLRLIELRDLPNWIQVALPTALRWALWMFLLNLIWEVAQLPLYALNRLPRWTSLIYAILQCSVGDAMVGFASYLLAALLTGLSEWPTHRPWPGLVVVVVAGVMFTIWAEWYNVYVLSSWAYAAGMPTIFGIGVSPIAQWIVLPPIAVAVMRYRQRIHGV